MRWTIVFTVLLTAAFIVIYKITGDIWAATNGAGIFVVIFLAGAAIRFSRLYELPWKKKAAGTLATFLMVGLAAHWIIMWRMTEWQYAQLQNIRRIIYNDEVLWVLKTPAYETFKEFRNSPPGASLGDVFKRLNPSGLPVIDSVIAQETGPVFASVTDSVVQLTQEARALTGYDTAFVNYDGRHGLAQIRITVAPEGASYDIQN